MKKVISIDGITLDRSCFISSEYDADDFLGASEVAIDGSTILFVQPKGALTKEVQITSRGSGFQKKQTKELLMASVGVSPIVVGFDNSTSDTYYYDHSRTPLQFEPLYDGSIWYTLTINLLKG